MIKAKGVPGGASHSRRVNDLVGLCFFCAGAACLLWLTWPDPAWMPQVVEPTLRHLAGSGAYVIPIILMFIGAMFLVGFDRMAFSHSSYGSLLLFLSFVTWRHLVMIGPHFLTPKNALDPRVDAAGGCIGGVLGTVLGNLLGHASYLFLLFMVCAALVLLLDKPFIEILRHLRYPADVGYAAARQGIEVAKQKTAERREIRAARPAERSYAGDAGTEHVPAVAGASKKRGLLAAFRHAPSESVSGEADAGYDQNVEAPAPVGETSGVRRQVDAESPKARSLTPKAKSEDIAALGTEINIAFKLPPLSLLREASTAQPRRAQQELTDKIKILEQTLDQFGIGANVVEIAHGPTVTRYEIQLAPGIKVSKIVSLADNLAMALAAIDVRVEAPIPGKSAIGIEVPNSTAALVPLREVIDTPEFRNAPGKLLFALGKDVSGTNRYADLSKMPHLLVGGSTNSGKSICLNTIIASLLYRATPREIQFLMIDPKRVELSLWDGIPHLMSPVVKDVKQTAGIFRSALKEMERRYDAFSRIGTRNIDGYNQRMSLDGREGDRLPYLVIVVDELADLMMQAAAEIETSICRLAQLARATGIHLVIATQRPSVDVITGLIKANISSRVAFAVSSQVDSRTILDMNGAERLIGRGDMLFLPIDASKPVRIQGCYLSEQETNSLVAYLKEQERPNYTLTPMEVGTISGAGSGIAGEDDSDDELYEAAVKLVVTNGHASTSMLQRRFKIGYTRAARLVDIMEDRGIVGPLDGAKPREILVTKDEIDQMFRIEGPQDEG